MQKLDMTWITCEFVQINSRGSFVVKDVSFLRPGTRLHLLIKLYSSSTVNLENSKSLCYRPGANHESFVTANDDGTHFIL